MAAQVKRLFKGLSAGALAEAEVLTQAGSRVEASAKTGQFLFVPVCVNAFPIILM